MDSLCFPWSKFPANVPISFPGRQKLLVDHTRAEQVGGRLLLLSSGASEAPSGRTLGELCILTAPPPSTCVCVVSCCAGV